MRPTTGRIDALTDAAEHRATRLRALVNGIGLPLTPEKHRILSFVVIEGFSLWDQFCRAFYLSTSLQARDPAGQPIQLGLQPNNAEDAITLAIRAVKKHLASAPGPFHAKDEPDWYRTGQWRTAMDNLRASNLPNVYRALGFQTTVLGDLPTMRNFYAHKSEPAATKARALRSNYRGLGKQALSPPELLCSYARGRPQSIVCDWMDDLHTVISLTR